MIKIRLNYLACLIVSLPAVSSAATLYIDTNDPSCSDFAGTPYCSIAAGINHASDGDTVSIGAGIYSEYLTIDKNLTLQGAGADATYIDGGSSGRPVHTHGIVTITNLTIQNGNVGEDGIGGGIYIGSGELTLTDSIVKNNHAGGGGGGISTGPSSSLTLIRTLITGNVAANTRGTGFGGGLNLSSSANIDIRDSTISHNVSGYAGGGIFTMGPSTTVTNSTFSGNVANGGGGGGAIANGSGSSGSITLNNVTITGNTASGYGGLLNTNGIVQLHNTVIAGNSDSGYGPDCGGMTITSNGYNYIGNTAGCEITTLSSDILDLGMELTRLGPLTDNGGLAQTHAIHLGSALIDAGDPSGCTDELGTVLTTDQTGGSRAVDGDSDGAAICDIGAFELKHGIVADPDSSLLVTTESQGTATFDMVLISQPTTVVTVSIGSSDTTEGTVSPDTLIFTAADWNVRQQVVVQGVDDSEVDGDVDYTVYFGPLYSQDPNYGNLLLDDLNATNSDNDTANDANGDGVNDNGDGDSDGGGGGAVDMIFLIMMITMVGCGVQANRVLIGKNSQNTH